MSAPPLILLNPHAGGGRARGWAPRLAAWAKAQPDQGHPEPELVVVEGVGSTLDLLRASAVGRRVVVAGGDGTLQTLLPAFVQRDMELGLLPCGTGNDNARAWGLAGMPWEQALELACRGPVRPTDLGWLEVQGRAPQPFLSSLCAGFDAAIGQRALRGPTFLRGTLRYLWATLGEIRHLRRYSALLTLDDGEPQAGDWLLASTLNTPTYGSGMPVALGAALDDGRLHVLTAQGFGRAGALAMLPLLLSGQHLRHPRVRLQAFKRLQIDARGPVPLAADGEPVEAAARFRIEVAPGALRVARRG